MSDPCSEKSNIDNLTKQLLEINKLFVDQQNNQEAMIEKALNKQREEIFGYVKLWTGLDPKNQDTGYKIRKAFEYSLYGCESNEKTLKVAKYVGSVVGIFFAVVLVISKFNLMALFQSK